MPTPFNDSPRVVLDESYDLLHTGQFQFPVDTGHAWWTSVTDAEFRVIPADPTSVDSFGAVAYDETGDNATVHSSPTSSTADWTPLTSKSAIQNLRITNLQGTNNKIRIRIKSKYY